MNNRHIYGEQLPEPIRFEIFYNKIFDSSEVDEICKISNNYQFQSARVGESGGEYNQQKRRSQVKWIPNIEETNWIYKRFENVALEVNQHYKFDLVGGEPIQYTEYHENEAGEYGWHTDYSTVNRYKYMRKMSVVVFLTDKEEFSGGDLVITSHVDDLFIPVQKKGYGVVFPSWIPHRVTPVFNGLRKSLVMWIYGPTFK